LVRLVVGPRPVAIFVARSQKGVKHQFPLFPLS
jgi:hypothetical protein